MRSTTRKKGALILLGLLAALAVLAASCASYSGNPPGSTDDQEREEVEFGSEIADPQQDTSDPVRKLVVTVDARIETEDVDGALRKVSDKAAELGGFVSDQSLQRSEDGTLERASLVVRIPPDRNREYSDFLRDVGVLRSLDQDSKDITDEYYDTRARLDNALAQEASLVRLLDKAETISEILEVEKRLGEVRETIERFQGQIRVWDSLVGLSSYTIYLSRKMTLSEGRGGPELIRFGEWLDAVVRGFRNSAVVLLNAGGYVLILLANLAIPLALAAIVVLAIVWTSRRNRRRRERQAGSPPLEPPAPPA